MGPLDHKLLASDNLLDKEAYRLGWAAAEECSSERKILDELRYMLLGEPSIPAFNDQQALLFAATVGSMSAVFAEESKELQGSGSCSLFLRSWPDSGQSIFPGLQGIGSSSERADDLESMVASANDVRVKVSTGNQFQSDYGSGSVKHGSGDLLVTIPRVASLPQFLSLHEPLF